MDVLLKKEKERKLSPNHLSLQFQQIQYTDQRSNLQCVQIMPERRSTLESYPKEKGFMEEFEERERLLDL